MVFDKVTRGEKISSIKLAVVQYGILALILALSSGLWRLQVLGAQNFRVLAEQNRIGHILHFTDIQLLALDPDRFNFVAAREGYLCIHSRLEWIRNVQRPLTPNNFHEHVELCYEA